MFCKEQNIELEPEIFPAATDSRFIREKQIPAFGFSPMMNCPILLHEHNEYIPIDVFEQGIDIYEKLLPRLFNKDAFELDCEVLSFSIYT